jgi:cyclophilin family peptidyl-prolyl cis-trans isomerase
LPRRQRRRRRGPTEYLGPSRAKPPFPINVIFNAKAFYIVFIVLIIASLAATAIASNSSSGKRSKVPEPEDRITAEETPNAALTFSGPAPTIDRSKSYLATIKTDKGDIKIDLAGAAPDTVNSFAFLAGNGFYNNTIFFYVDKQYAAQGGDPTCRKDAPGVCSGAGGPGYSLPLQNADAARKQWDVVAPALVQGGEDVSGSQFRILYRDDPRPNVKETVFGKVVDGTSILEGLSDFTPCSVASSANCDRDLSSALVINEIIVEPKVV